MPFDGITLSPVTKLLMETRRIVERGWCQSVMRAPGAFCIVGALREASPSEENYMTARNQLGRAANCTNLVQWNDDLSRTKEEVLKVCDLAIENEMAHIEERDRAAPSPIIKLPRE